MIRNALYIQSGGPTAVINASAYGVITACRENSDKIGKLYGTRNGIVGLLEEDLIDIYKEAEEELELLIQTPSMIFGSCRYRITQENDYDEILRILIKYDIGYIFYNGGNGTVCACMALMKYLENKLYDCNIIVIPKTVDNDIEEIDHSPGFASTARHVVITISELSHDIRVYDTGLISVIEVMGRNTGWLAAATLLAGKAGNGPDLIYVPEVGFYPEKFISDVRTVYEKKRKCMVVVAEGVKDSNGKYLFEYNGVSSDNPYLNMGGITPYLTSLLRKHFDCKVRGIDLGLMQRCAAHTSSEIDISEAVKLGENAVYEAVSGQTGKMVTIRRISSIPYREEYDLVPVERALGGHTLPAEYITEEKNYIKDTFLEYIEPLVGELPVYSRLNLKKAED